MTRDELLAWVDGHAGDPFTISVEIASSGAQARILSSSGTLEEDPRDPGAYRVGEMSLDVSTLDDAQIGGATPGSHHAQENLRIPLATNVSILLEDGIIESG
jgi:hypothetical protein